MKIFDSFIVLFTILNTRPIVPTAFVQARPSSGISHAVDVDVEFKDDKAEAYLDTTRCTMITGTVVVPTIIAPSERPDKHGLLVWIGIDGRIAAAKPMRLGLKFSVNKGGEIAMAPWFDWEPPFSYVLLSQSLGLSRRILRPPP